MVSCWFGVDDEGCSDKDVIGICDGKFEGKDNVRREVSAWTPYVGANGVA